MKRRDCRYHLTYGGNSICRFAWVKNILSKPKELTLGCDVDGVRCPNYNPLMWKREALPEVEREALEEDNKRSRSE
jgi:hypothetical protein